MSKFKSLIDSSVKQAEAEVSEYWNDINILEKTLEKGKNDPSFVFYEGPPTANVCCRYPVPLEVIYADGENCWSLATRIR